MSTYGKIWPYIKKSQAPCNIKASWCGAHEKQSEFGHGHWAADTGTSGIHESRKDSHRTLTENGLRVYSPISVEH